MCWCGRYHEDFIMHDSWWYNSLPENIRCITNSKEGTCLYCSNTAIYPIPLSEFEQ